METSKKKQIELQQKFNAVCYTYSRRIGQTFWLLRNRKKCVRKILLQVPFGKRLRKKLREESNK